MPADLSGAEKLLFLDMLTHAFVHYQLGLPMALRLSDRILEGIAVGTFAGGVFLAILVARLIGGALFQSHSQTAEPGSGRLANSGSWVTFSILAAVVVGVAFVANRIAIRRNNTDARRAAKWGIYLNVGGYITYAMFYLVWNVWQT